MTELDTVRALHYQFRQHMNDNGGWPKDKPTLNWFLENGFPKDRNALAALRAGQYVALKYTSAFIGMLSHAPRDRELWRAHEALNGFIRAKGLSPLSEGGISLVQTISHTCTPVTAVSALTKKRRKTPFADVLQLGFKMFPDFPLGYIVENVVRGVSGAYPARDAVTWTFVGFARSQNPDGHLVGEKEAIRFSEEVMKIPYDEYVRLATGWARVSPWSVIFARRETRLVGASILLPVKQHVYEEVRAGVRATSFVEPEDVQVPSHWIIFESLFENPEFEPHADTSAVEHIRMAIAAQHAAVMQYDPRNAYTRYHFIAVEATPTNTARLSAVGFKVTETRNAVNGLPLWEKIVDLGVADGGATPLEETILRLLAPLTRGAPRPAESYRGRR